MPGVHVRHEITKTRRSHVYFKSEQMNGECYLITEDSFDLNDCQLDMDHHIGDLHSNIVGASFRVLKFT